MNLSGTADSWEITVTAGNRKQSNPTTGTLELTRGGSGGVDIDRATGVGGTGGSLPPVTGGGGGN